MGANIHFLKWAFNHWNFLTRYPLNVVYILVATEISLGFTSQSSLEFTSRWFECQVKRTTWVDAIAASATAMVSTATTMECFLTCNYSHDNGMFLNISSYRGNLILVQNSFHNMNLMEGGKSLKPCKAKEEWGGSSGMSNKALQWVPRKGIISIIRF